MKLRQAGLGSVEVLFLAHGSQNRASGDYAQRGVPTAKKDKTNPHTRLLS
jgi:hypothetical protein